ncbi:MAG: hypothetical protein IKZ48_06775 [Prevotella sp.]|nr:hypothetical protein [Prevotella sp.]
MKKLLTIVIGLMLVTTASAGTKALFLTGGQSNTDGRLYATTLPAYLQSANTNCLVSYHAAYSESRLGKFYAYYPTSEGIGQPGRWAYDAVAYYYIAQALQETFYVAKTSYGGTSIHPGVSNSGGTVNGAPFIDGYGSGYHWSADPTFLAATAIAGTNFVKNETTYTGQSMLLAWIANIDAAIDAITAQGDTPDIKAIIWHQGESDRNAGGYYENLKAMVKYVRDHLVEKTGESKYASLPFFCGTIPHASSLYSSAVEKAFFTLEDEDANFHAVDLRDLTMLSDTKHFDAPSAELFGKRLYNRMVDEHVITGDKLDVEYAQVDYSDFGTDEFVGETKTWDFNGYTSDLVTSTTIQDNLYLHSNGMNSRRFLSQSPVVSSVTFADGTEVSVSRVLTSNNGGAYQWSPSDIVDTYNASKRFTLTIAANVLYPGRFSVMMSVPSATTEVPQTAKLIFNGKVVKELAFTSNAPQELYFDAPAAGTIYMYSGSQFSLYAVRYVPTVDRTGQRTVTTDADGYAPFGNITGANLGLPSGLTAWAVVPSAESNEKVDMNQLLGVDKGTAALLQGAPSTQYVLPFAWTAQEYEGENDMTAQQTTGEIEETSGEDFINYIFANKQFTKASSPVSVAAGSAYLSISNGAAHCDNSTLTFDEPEADAETDCGRDFGAEVVVSEARTWTLESMTVPTYQDTEAVEYNGLYSKAQGGSNNRSWKTGTANVSTSFSDGTEVTATRYYTLNNDAGSSSTSGTATAAKAGMYDYFAINALYPGTFYALISSGGDAEKTHSIYFNGTSVATKTTTSTTVEELKYTATEAGTFVYHSGLSGSRVYAFRFVPTTDNTALRQATMNAEGYATFTNIALAPLTLPDGLEAYALLPGDIDDDVTKKVEATVIGKGEAVLLKGSAGETYTMTIDNTQTSDVDGENLLKPVLAWNKPLANNTETGNAQYILNGDVFTKADGTTKVYQKGAILSVPTANVMANYGTVKLTPEGIGFDKIEAHTLFGNDEVVTQETIWLTGDMTTPGSDGVVQQLNGLYGRGQKDSKNRSFFKASGNGSATFSDGTAVNWTSHLYINYDYNSSWTLNASTTANTTTCGDYLAANIAVPGTFYVLFSSKDASQERTLDLYYEGTKSASATSTGSGDIKEIKYEVAEAGTLVLDCRNTCRVYALRFVPANAGVYNRVTAIGWGSMSLPYPAVVPDGTCVYYVSDYEDGTETGTLTLTKVDAGGVIPAKQGFLFNGGQGLYRFEKSMTPGSWTGNMLVGTADAAMTGYDHTNAADPIYVLASLDANTVGFKKFTGTSIARYKAYLQLGTMPTARAFRISIDEMVDGGGLMVDGGWLMVDSGRLMVDGGGLKTYYNLSGQRVNANHKGIVIKNGRMVFVK